MEEVIESKAIQSRKRLNSLGLSYEYIFAKINPIEPNPPESSVVFVITRDFLPSIPTSSEEGIKAYRNYPTNLDLHLRSRQQETHPQSVINMCELVKSRLIYSGNDPVTKQIAYWYMVQSGDILSRYVAAYDPAIPDSYENRANDDVSRGYIVLLDDDKPRKYNFTIVESCPSKGGKSSSLVKRKKRKNITKKRRKSRISRRKH